MDSEFSRPDSDVAVRVLAAFTDRAVRAALRSGYRPTRQWSFWLSLSDSAWASAVELVPAIADNDDQVLVVNPVVTVSLMHAEPSNRMLGWSAKVPYWPHPRLSVERTAEPEPLDVWPDDHEGLLEFARAAEKETRQRVIDRLDDLNAATERWWADADDRLERLATVLKEWESDSYVFEDFLETGTAYAELVALRQAMVQFVAASSGASHDAVADDVPDLVHTPVAAVDLAVRGPDRDLHFAIDAVVPKVKEGLEAGAEARRRRSQVDEAAEWVAEHGSARLKKAVEANVLEHSLGAYRDERLALERPGWMWVAQVDSKAMEKVAVNPSEEALTALLEARKADSHAYLAFHEGERVQVLVCSFMYRRIWRPIDDRWDEDRFKGRSSRVVTVQAAFPRPSYDPAEEPF